MEIKLQFKQQIDSTAHDATHRGKTCTMVSDVRIFSISEEYDKIKTIKTEKKLVETETIKFVDRLKVFITIRCQVTQFSGPISCSDLRLAIR